MKRIIKAVGLICIACVMVWYAAGVVLQWSQRRYIEIPCQQNLLRISRALVAYAKSHNGAFPPDLKALVAERCADSEDFICPEAGDKEGAASDLNQWTSFAYVSGLQATNNPDLPIVICFPLNNNGFQLRAVHVGGYCSRVAASELTAWRTKVLRQFGTIDEHRDIRVLFRGQTFAGMSGFARALTFGGLRGTSEEGGEATPSGSDKRVP